jgi:fermentation-respiration switch protein FrsA (DUF1100 family)
LIKTRVEDFKKDLNESDLATLNLDGGRLETQIQQLSTPWFRFFFRYEPRESLLKVKCPVLALNGELDLQVHYVINLDEIEKALVEAGNRNYKVKMLKGLNHLFQHCETGSPLEYAKIEETFAPEALEAVSGWILGLFAE